MSRFNPNIIDGFHFSPGNRKLGPHLANFSLAQIVTCPRGVPCSGKCYACSLYNVFPNWRNGVRENTAQFVRGTLPDSKHAADLAPLPAARTDAARQRWHDLAAAAVLYIKAYRHDRMRWNVSGDIFCDDYLRAIYEAARATPDCTHLLFTKWYARADRLESERPANVVIFRSAWKAGMLPAHPELYPVAYYDDGTPEAAATLPAGTFVCPEDCEHCRHCFDAGPGDGVIFEDHGNGKAGYVKK